jgi:fucose 4-O-acetylase-like acetyltransferase
VYYLDWMRIISIYLVVSYHVVQALDWIGMWCGDQHTQSISFRCVALQLGMPLFFHISGRAQGLVKIKSLWGAVSSRFMRLIVPFLIFWAILIPPWIWISERDTQHACIGPPGTGPYKTSWEPNPSIPQDLFTYLVKFWTFQTGVFKFDPAWLWFLPILFLATVSSLPVMMFAEERRAGYLLPAFIWWLLQAVVVVFVLPGYRWGFCVFLGLAPFGTAAISWYVPFTNTVADAATLEATAYHRYLAIRVCTAVNVIATVGCVMCLYYNEMGDEVLKVIPQMFMYPIFYLHGFFVERWWPEQGGSKLYLHDQQSQTSQGGKVVRISEICLKFLAFIVIFAGSPVGEWETSCFPIYSMSFKSESIFAISYVLGTWAWLSIADSLFQAYNENVVDPEIHKHASGSTIVVYIFHWMFIKIWCWFVIRDLYLTYGFWKYFAVLSTWIVGVVPSLGVYWFFYTHPKIGKVLGV